ncbi:MAG TPA: hypothetical protein VN240_09715 [Propylenella sp.]|nr:hypothetical protein [Propylenella sp.]
MTTTAPQDSTASANSWATLVFHRILDVIVVATVVVVVVISADERAVNVAGAIAAGIMMCLKIFFVIMDKVMEYDLQSFVFLMALISGPLIAVASAFFRNDERVSTALVAIGSALFGMGAGANLEKTRHNKTRT